MMLPQFPQYIIDNGVLMYERSRRIIKPDDQGRYRLKKKGQIHLVTMDQLKRKKKSADDAIKKELDSTPTKVEVLIDSYLAGHNMSEAGRVAGTSAQTASNYYRKFKETNFGRLCKLLHISPAVVKRQFFNDSDYKEYDHEDILRIVAQYIRKNKPLITRCLEVGVDRDSFRSFVSYNFKDTINNDNFEYYLDKYINRGA